MNVKALRESYGLNVFAFSAILGVHVTTVYRWEATIGNGARIELLQARIIDAMSFVKMGARKKIGETALRVLQEHGELTALGCFLGELLEQGGER